MSQLASAKPTLGRTLDEATGLKSGIYRIICKINRKVYIGSAVNIAGRWRVHICGLAKNQHHSPHLQRAWNKYGPGAFVFEVAEWVENDRLIEREQFHIDAAKSTDHAHGFNISPTAGSTLGVVHSEESRRKMSEGQRNRAPASEETRKKLSEVWLGRRHTEETRQKMREAQRGRRPSQETQRKGTEAWRGRKHSEETRKKLSELNRGRTMPPRSEEHRKKIGDSNRGRKHTEETRQKMREAQRSRPPVSEETRRKLSEVARNRDPDHLQKMQEARRGKTHSEEALQKMRKARLRWWALKKQQLSPPEERQD